jgi:hypothetical protein
MSFTYDLSTDIGKARLLIGDTFDLGHVLTDEEITYLLSLETNIEDKYNLIWNKYIDILATRVDSSLGGESVSNKQAYDNSLQRYSKWLSSKIIEKHILGEW